MSPCLTLLSNHSKMLHEALLQFVFFPGKVSMIGDLEEGDWKWHGGSLGADGAIYGIPAHADSVLKIQPETGEVKTIGASNGFVWSVCWTVLLTKSILQVKAWSQNHYKFWYLSSDSEVDVITCPQANNCLPWECRRTFSRKVQMAWCRLGQWRMLVWYSIQRTEDFKATQKILKKEVVILRYFCFNS